MEFNRIGLTPIVIFNMIVWLFFTLAYFYQFVYLIRVAARGMVKLPPAKKLHRYAFFISAHNEEPVIGNLVRSILAQDYPRELMDVFVVCDACTDNTHEEAERAGAIVWDRNDLARRGKSWAMDYGFDRILNEYGDKYEGFFVFDADNVLEENYIEEMNKVFSQGYGIVTSYRNSKNFGDNWISSGYALWFLRESQFLNHARFNLGTSCAVSGTGFLFSQKVLDDCGGWHFHLLTEDIEFSAASIIDGVRISYCPTAVLYDEQPATFRASWNQRLRWTKGFYQVFARYGGALVKGIFQRHSFQCYDMLMVIAPATLLTLSSLLFNGGCLLAGLVSGSPYVLESAAMGMGGCLLSVYCSLLVFGAVTVLAEQRQIHCSKPRQLLYLLMFPVFIFT
mgnify:CR=1 FL=1